MSVKTYFCLFKIAFRVRALNTISMWQSPSLWSQGVSGVSQGVSEGAFSEYEYCVFIVVSMLTLRTSAQHTSPRQHCTLDIFAWVLGPPGRWTVHGGKTPGAGNIYFWTLEAARVWVLRKPPVSGIRVCRCRGEVTRVQPSTRCAPGANQFWSPLAGLGWAGLGWLRATPQLSPAPGRHVTIPSTQPPSPPGAASDNCNLPGYCASVTKNAVL